MTFNESHCVCAVVDAGQVCGAVKEMRWTPDGTALAMCWQHGGFSIWSVFGSLLHHSMAVEAGSAIRHPYVLYRRLNLLTLYQFCRWHQCCNSLPMHFM